MYADACKDLKIIIHVLLGLRRIRNLHSNKCLKAHHPHAALEETCMESRLGEEAILILKHEIMKARFKVR
jgi:hypothetical protein